MSDAPATVSSQIDRVTVFRFGAEVRRVAELLLPSSYPAEIRISGLPLQLRDETMQLAVEPLGDTPAEACPQAVDLRVALEPPPPDPSLPPATDEELRQAQRQVRRRQSAAKHLEVQLAAIDELASPTRPSGAEGEPPPASPTLARLALLEFQRSEQDRLYDALADAREELRLAQEALGALQARRHSQQQRRQLEPHELRKEARVTLRAPGSASVSTGSCRIVLSYLVPAARWAPAYSLRIDTHQQRATINLRAHVCQLTDEDWRGVQLVLSTADAMRWAELPKLHALRIGRAQPPSPRTGWRPPPQGVEALFEDWLRAKALAPSPGGASSPPAPPPPQASPTPRSEPSPVCEPEEEAMEMELAAECAPARSKRRAVLSRAPAAPAPKSSSFFGASLAPAAAQVAAPAATSAYGDAPIAGAVTGGGPPPPPPAIEAGRDLLNYDGLRMPPPEHPRRGHLEAIDSLEAYQELLTDTMRESLPGGAALHAHTRDAAERVRLRALGTGLQAPASIDAYDHAWWGELPVDVPSDGSFHSVPVLGAHAPARIHHIAVPRETQEVFRAVRMDNPLQAPLLPGPVDVYLDGDYLLAASVGSVPAGGEIELGLGVEQGIRVSRNTRYAESQRGVVSRHQDLVHELEIELRNLLACPAEIEVRERVPVHQEDDEDVAIELRQVQPAWEAWEQPRAPMKGAHRWRLTIEPGQVRQLRATYVVTISPKHELVGGNRREG